MAAPATLAAVSIVLLALMTGCATPPADPAERAAFERTNDPFEPTNRVVFAANMFVDRWAIEPIAEGYRDVVPDLVQIWVRNFIRWAHEPTVLANNVLQGEYTRAGKTTARFAINTLLGPLGLRDMAKQAGFKPQSGDFGQTLHVWGFPEGPYLVLPLLGPSNVRDLVGLGADTFMDPLRYVEEVRESALAGWGRFVVEGIDERAQYIDAIDEMRRNSLDFYAQMRSIVRQRRTAQLNGSTATSLPTVPDAGDLYTDPAAGAPPVAAPK